MQLPKFFGTKSPSRRRLRELGIAYLGIFVILKIAQHIIFGFQVRFINYAVEMAIILAAVNLTWSILPVFSNDEPETMPSVVKQSDRDETQVRVNRSSPEVKE
jgi:hypothetical protein